MNLKLYDTLTREKRDFVPLDPKRVRMYVCGPTVYDFAHIGNARPVIVFDVLFRVLRHLYGAEDVKYVRNITDVDDKINARAAERGISIRELTETTYKNFKEDVAALGCLAPTVEPRATEHIEEMKVLIERLVASGNAYVAEDHVLFAVATMPDYGKLARRPLDGWDPSRTAFAGAAMLTPREHQVLAQIVGCASNKVAATKLGISRRTVEIHRAHIMQKLGAKNSVDLMRIVMSRTPEDNPHQLSA